MDYAATQRQALGSVGVVAMGALAVGSISILDEWVGDIGALLWILGAFWFPFLAGLALGSRAKGTSGRAIGAAIGASVVLIPTIGYALVERPDLAGLQLPLLWTLFTPLAMAQGAVAIPVAANDKKA